PCRVSWPGGSRGCGKADGGGVFGGCLPVSPAQFRPLKIRQGAMDEGPAQSDAPVRGNHPKVLDRADGAVVHDALNRGNVALGTGDQPRGPGQEAGLAADLAHQPLASVAVSQAREHVGVDLMAEALEFDLGVVSQQGLLPGYPDKAA